MILERNSLAKIRKGCVVDILTLQSCFCCCWFCFALKPHVVECSENNSDVKVLLMVSLLLFHWYFL